MLLDVPFYASTQDTDCGPLALKMALAYLGEEHSFNKLSKLERQLSTGLVWSAGIARAARKLGFKVIMSSTTNFTPEEDDIEYYKKYAKDKGMIILKELIKEIRTQGVEIREENMSLNELLHYVTEDSLPIVLVNWYVIAGKEGFSGHFLPVTGYDETHVYVHNPGLANAKAHLPLTRELFVKAWESKGTDKDTIIIFRKKTRKQTKNYQRKNTKHINKIKK